MPNSLLAQLFSLPFHSIFNHRTRGGYFYGSFWSVSVSVSLYFTYRYQRKIQGVDYMSIPCNCMFYRYPFKTATQSLPAVPLLFDNDECIVKLDGKLEILSQLDFCPSKNGNPQTCSCLHVLRDPNIRWSVSKYLLAFFKKEKFHISSRHHCNRLVRICL